MGVLQPRSHTMRAMSPNPMPTTELEYTSVFELLVAVLLSAQATDVGVNKATRRLFPVAHTPAQILALGQDGLESHIRTIGLYRTKAANLLRTCEILLRQHGGEVPRSREALEALPGVGRKTANVVLGVAFGAPEGVVVDTHVQRLSQRLGFTKETEPERIEKALCGLLPRDLWDITSHTLIFHGRRVCFARKPACATCSVRTLCPSAFEAEEVGRIAADGTEDVLGLHDLAGEVVGGDRDQRRDEARLPDAGVAADRGEHRVPRPDRRGEVEGGDDADRSQRMPLLVHPVLRALAVHREAVELAGETDAEVGDVDRLLDLADALGLDLSHLERHQGAEIGAALAEGVADLPDDLAALRRRQPTPMVLDRIGAGDDVLIRRSRLELHVG